MLNGEGDENGKKSIDLISKKKKTLCPCSTHRPSTWRIYCTRLAALFYSLSLFFIVLLQPLLRLLIYIYIYMYTCSFIVHILPPFVDLYIIHYVFIAYSTLNIVSFVCIYI